MKRAGLRHSLLSSLMLLTMAGCGGGGGGEGSGPSPVQPPDTVDPITPITPVIPEDVELFISEYSGGPGVNRYIEIYNNSGAELSLRIMLTPLAMGRISMTVGTPGIISMWRQLLLPIRYSPCAMSIVTK